MDDSHPHRIKSTKCRINTAVSVEIDKYTKNKLSTKWGLFTRLYRDVGQQNKQTKIMFPVLCELFGFRSCIVEVSSCRTQCNRHRVTDARRCEVTSRNVRHPSSTIAALHPFKRRCKVAALVSNTSCLIIKTPHLFSVARHFTHLFG